MTSCIHSIENFMAERYLLHHKFTAYKFNTDHNYLFTFDPRVLNIDAKKLCHRHAQSLQCPSSYLSLMLIDVSKFEQKNTVELTFDF